MLDVKGRDAVTSGKCPLCSAWLNKYRETWRCNVCLISGRFDDPSAFVRDSAPNYYGELEASKDPSGVADARNIAMASGMTDDLLGSPPTPTGVGSETWKPDYVRHDFSSREAEVCFEKIAARPLKRVSLLRESAGRIFDHWAKGRVELVKRESDIVVLEGELKVWAWEWIAPLKAANMDEREEKSVEMTLKARIQHWKREAINRATDLIMPLQICQPNDSAANSTVTIGPLLMASHFGTDFTRRPGFSETPDSPGFWRDMQSQFGLVKHPIRLVATVTNDRWTFTFDGSTDRSERARLRTLFDSLAERAGIALAPARAETPRDSWLNYLRDESPHFQRINDGDFRFGWIQDVVVASAEYCVLCETRAFDLTANSRIEKRKATTRPQLDTAKIVNWAYVEGWTNTTLAAKLGKSTRAISSLRNNRSNHGQDTVEALAKLMNCEDVADLYLD